VLFIVLYICVVHCAAAKENMGYAKLMDHVDVNQKNWTPVLLELWEKMTEVGGDSEVFMPCVKNISIAHLGMPRFIPDFSSDELDQIVADGICNDYNFYV